MLKIATVGIKLRRPNVCAGAGPVQANGSKVCWPFMLVHYSFVLYCASQRAFAGRHGLTISAQIQKTTNEVLPTAIWWVALTYYRAFCNTSIHNMPLPLFGSACSFSIMFDEGCRWGVWYFHEQHAKCICQHTATKWWGADPHINALWAWSCRCWYCL